jgi:cyclopropane fatty-acyl-phospholipid synthase-like methyltransferase
MRGEGGMTSWLLHLYRLTRRPIKPPATKTSSLENEFQENQSDAVKFWSRFGKKPDFGGKRVLDVGCGLGAMVFDIADEKATRSVGVDIHVPYIEFKREKLEKDYPHLKDVVTFFNQQLSELEEGDFDIIISKDSFEHILNLEECLQDMATRMKPDGRMFVAFSPLWRSVRGDHGRTFTRLPWGHVIFPERVLLQGLREIFPERKIESIDDLGLNCVSLRQFKAMLARTGLKATHLRVNDSKKLAMKLYNLGRLLPGLAEYFTHNIYAVLEKDAAYDTKR